MDVESIRDHALLKENVTEGFPFGDGVLVFKVNNKIFLLISLDEMPLRFNVKCDPSEAVELRELYPGYILPGYHMNKKHWNTVIMDGHLPASLVKSMIDASYDLVCRKK